MKVQRDGRNVTVKVVADGDGLVSHAGAALTAEAAERLFLMGLDLTERVRSAILALPERAWRPALRQDGETREGAWVAELTSTLELGAWPPGTRVWCAGTPPPRRPTVL